MSVQAITAALAVQGVTSSEKLLLIVLANYADEHFKCWPSQSTLASNTMLSERNVRRILATLEEKTVISRRVRYNGRGRSSDLITLNLVADTVSGTKSVNKSRTVSDLAATPRTPCPERGDTMSGEPIIDTKREPSARGRSRDGESAAPALEGIIATLRKPAARGPPKETPQQMAARIRKLAG